MEINHEGEIIGEDEISVDTVRGCWETAPKDAEAILHFKEQLSKQQFTDQQEVNWGVIVVRESLSSESLLASILACK